MIASARNGCSEGSSLPYTPAVYLRRPFPGSMHDLQQPSRISAISLRRLLISPSATAFIDGIREGFFTMNAMSAAGSPPMLKNSKPLLSTKSLNTGWVARRTRCL